MVYARCLSSRLGRGRNAPARSPGSRWLGLLASLMALTCPLRVASRSATWVPPMQAPITTALREGG